MNLASWLAANLSGTYPYNCPSPALTTPPSTGSTRATRRPSTTPPGGRLSVTDPLGDTTSYTYDPAGHASRRRTRTGRRQRIATTGKVSGSECASGTLGRRHRGRSLL